MICEFELPNVSLRCFVVRQLLSCIYALSSVKFSGLKLWLCKKSDKYEVCWPPSPLQPGTCSLAPLFAIREVTLEVNFVPVKISCRCCCSGGNGRVEITWPQEMGDNKSSFLFLQTANTAFLDHSACGPYL